MQSTNSFTNEPSSRIPELPTLESGLTLLETEGDPRVPLQTLAVDHLLEQSGRATWVGTGRYCTTDTLADIAPDRTVLERVDIARGFTPYQHTALINGLDVQVSDDTAVIVLPTIDTPYRGDDVQGGDGQDMLVRVLAQVARVAREQGLPVLCTRSQADEFASPVEAAAASTVSVRQTAMGPQFVGEEFETLVYPLEGDWVQTTLAFWQEVLAARQPLHQSATRSPEVFAGGPV